MSLNNGVLDDLDNTVVDDDLVKSPSVVNNTGKPVTVTVKTAEVTDDVTRLEPHQINELLTSDVSFKIVKDNVAKVVELTDVESNILSQESINRSDAEYIDQTFSGLITDTLTLEEFTALPSKTNYVYATKHMNKRISQEALNVVSSFQLYLDKPLLDSKEILEKFKDELLPYVLDGIRSIRLLSDSLSSDIVQNKNLVVPMSDGTFVNIGTTDIAILDLSQVAVDFDKELYSKAVANLKSIFAISSVKRFILGSVDNVPVESLFSNDPAINRYTEYNDAAVSLIDIAKFYESEAVVSYLEDLVKSIDQAIDQVSEIQAKSEECKDNYVSINKFLIENNLSVQNMHRAIKTLAEVLTGINHLNLNSAVLLDLCKKF